MSTERKIVKKTESFSKLTTEQVSSVYEYAEDIINNFTPKALKEILSKNNNDSEKLLETIIEETYHSIYPSSEPIETTSHDYLNSLSSRLDETLRKRSFNYFMATVLSDFEVSWHHLEWGSMVQIYLRLCIEAARDHSKSYTFSLAYPIWKMYRYEPAVPYRRIDKEYTISKYGMLITDRFKLARHLLKLIKNEIQSNDILREKLLPEGKEGWGTDELVCKNGATLMLGSFDSGLRGLHPGYIIVDDFLNKSALYSSEQRQKYTEVFKGEITNMILPGGSIIVVGTPFHEDDLYGQLKKDKSWRVFEYPAIFPDGKLLWKDRYDLDSLLEKKDSQGTLIFSREILVKPITDAASIFPYHILQKSFIGMDEYTLVENIHSFKRKFVRTVIGCDFAISSSAGADYSVFTVLGQDELDNYWLLNQYREKGANYNKQIAMLKQLNANFMPELIFGEDNVFQKVMIDMAKDANLPIVGHTTGVNKFDLEKGLPGLAVLFERNRIKFPRGDEHSKSVTDIIVGELSSITWTDKKRLESVSEHDDTVYSLWIAVLASRYVNEGFGFGFL